MKLFKKDYIGLVFPIMRSEESKDGFIWKYRVYTVKDGSFDYYTHDFEYPGRRMCKKAMRKRIKDLRSRNER